MCGGLSAGTRGGNFVRALYVIPYGRLDLGTSTVTVASSLLCVGWSHVPICLVVHSSLTPRSRICPTTRSTLSISLALLSLICLILVHVATSVICCVDQLVTHILSGLQGVQYCIYQVLGFLSVLSSLVPS